MMYEVSASDLLIFGDTMSPSIKAETLEDVINFADGVFSNFSILSAVDSIAFDDYATVASVLYLGITDTLAITDTTQPRVWVVTLSDFLFIWDVVDQPVAGVIRDSFGLSEVVVFTNSKLLNPDTVTFTDALVVQFFPNKILEESILFSDTISNIRINGLAPYIPQ